MARWRLVRISKWSNESYFKCVSIRFFFFFQAEDGIRDDLVTGVQTCALPILAEKLSEFRRQNSDNFSATPGTFSFPNIAAFLADQANSFSATDSNRSNRTYGDRKSVV